MRHAAEVVREHPCDEVVVALEAIGMSLERTALLGKNQLSRTTFVIWLGSLEVPGNT